MLKVEESTTSCAVEAVLFNSDTLSKIIPYLQTETSRGKTTSDLFNLALTCTRLGISNNDVSLIEESARIAVDDIIAIDSSLSHWCYEGENSLADYHRIRSAQDNQKKAQRLLKGMVLIEHDESGKRKLVDVDVTDDGQITFKDINLGGRQRGRRRRDAVLFNSDTLSKVISYLTSIDLLNLGLTCKRFGIVSNNDDDSLIKESVNITVHDIATEEQLAALPDGESSLADYHYLQLLRQPLTFDQLVGRAKYLNEGKSCVKHRGSGDDWATAFSNTIMRAGKHYVTFQSHSQSKLDSFIGLMRSGQANQDTYGLPLHPKFFQNFSQNMRYGERNNINNNVDCCLCYAYTGSCFIVDWKNFDKRSYDHWDGWEATASGDELGMLLDLDEGTLSVYKNSRKLGVTRRGLAGPYCWVVSLHRGAQVTIKRGMVPPL